MASTPFLLVVSAAVESFAVIVAVPHLLPANPLTYVFIRALAFNCVAYAFYLVLIYPRFVSPLRHIPGPKGGNFLIGRIKSTFERPPGQDFLQWVKEIPNDGFIRFFGLFGRELILVTNPKALSEILVSKSYTFQKPDKGRDFLRMFLGDGLVVTEGDQHRFQRKNTMPVFSFRHIKDLYPMMWTKAVGLVTRVDKEGEGQPTQTIDISAWSMKATMDAIGVAGLGREFNTLVNSDDPLIRNFEEIVEPSTEKVVYAALGLIFGPEVLSLIPWKVNGRMRVTTTNLRVICRELVASKKHLIEKRGDEHLDILATLIKSNNFSDDELVDQMLTFLAAGHETTSSSFEWATYLLATHPEIQTRLREELKSAHLNLNPEDPTTPDLATSLEALPLLNGVCYETLRLYPTVPMTLRESQEATVICGQHFPKNTRLVLSMWATNRSPELWGPDSEKFTPERWVDADTGKPNNHGGAGNNYSLLTFLHGPRSCIGQGFAKAELRCLIAAWVSSFKFEMVNPKEKIIASGAITIKPKNGLNLRITKV